MKKAGLLTFILVFIAFVSFSQHKLGLNIGNKAPDITGKSLNGETIKLSDTKGKLVLLDFWAAWCGPCRQENPVLVSVYSKFMDKNFQSGKGFTVFSVSLDRTDAAWRKAIKDDGLKWKYHISDLKGWYSKYAAIYGVRRIPSNFLLNAEGIIIAKNLRGHELEKTLQELVK